MSNTVAKTTDKGKDMAWKVILLTEITFWRYIIYCGIENR
jgi:hypothetical protein